MHTLDWSDLRFLLAVAEEGSLASAARALGVNHTTVLRRLGAFEQQLGVRLFDRLPTGYSLTGAGEEVAEVARQMRDTVAAVERRLVGRDLRLSGSVRLTTTDTLAPIVMASLAPFAATHPVVELEVTTTNVMVSLTKRDADVAVRPTSKPPPHLVGRRVARVAFALYAARSYLARVPARRDLEKHTWVAPDDSLATTTAARWMAKTMRNAPIALRADSFVALAHAAVAGIGVAALPCYLGDAMALERVRGVMPDMATELWVLTHEDLRATARVRALIDVLVASLGERRHVFEGR
jgi:DNA-binding transcriptional LysR family regulator